MRTKEARELSTGDVIVYHGRERHVTSDAVATTEPGEVRFDLEDRFGTPVGTVTAPAADTVYLSERTAEDTQY